MKTLLPVLLVFLEGLRVHFTVMLVGWGGVGF